jgi:hypothetical protein
MLSQRSTSLDAASHTYLRIIDKGKGMRRLNTCKEYIPTNLQLFTESPRLNHDRLRRDFPLLTTPYLETVSFHYALGLTDYIWQRELGKAFGGLAGWGIELRGSLQLHLVIGFKILVVYLGMHDWFYSGQGGNYGRWLVDSQVTIKCNSQKQSNGAPKVALFIWMGGLEGGCRHLCLCTRLYYQGGSFFSSTAIELTRRLLNCIKSPAFEPQGAVIPLSV